MRGEEEILRCVWVVEYIRPESRCGEGRWSARGERLQRMGEGSNRSNSKWHACINVPE